MPARQINFRLLASLFALYENTLSTQTSSDLIEVGLPVIHR